ncbi:MAG: MFS transporter [bacterium]
MNASKHTEPPNLTHKWRNLTLLALAELLAMGLWFSASAVLPQLTDEWHLTSSQQSWMTMSVQLGFVAGALISAIFNLADRLSIRHFFAFSAIFGAACNAAIPFIDSGPNMALVLRFFTGMAMAGVYPPGMKLMATWCKEDRGLGIGILVGALTLGSAIPHLLNAMPLLSTDGMPPWRSVLYVASLFASLGTFITGFCVQSGPYLSQTAPFNWKYAGQALTYKPTRLANFGYLGHMWELYAAWAWAPIFLIASYEQANWTLKAARLAGFGFIGAGAAGSVLAGILADRLGRTTISNLSLVLSGLCTLAVGFFFSSPGILTMICLIWGFAIVADSAQFSTAISELSDPRYVGTSLTVQTSLGFLLTILTIHLIPPLVDAFGWQWVFVTLTPGPIFGIWSMLRLRRLPEANKMASGNK